MRNFNSPVSALLVVFFAALVAGCGGSYPEDPNKTLPPPTPEVFFKGTFDEALAQSTQTGKPLLVVGTASWALPSQRLDKETWTDPTLSAWMSANTVPVIVDIDKDPDTAARLNLAVPIPIIMIMKNGVESSRTKGFMPPTEMLNWLKGAV